MTDPISDTFAPRSRSAPEAGGGYAAQAIRYERVLGWVLWIGLLGVLIVMSR